MASTVILGCAAEGAPETGEVDDVEDLGGKADGVVVTGDPLGRFVAEAAGTVEEITLRSDKTFARTIAGVTETGTYKFSRGGNNRYIRFLDDGGALIDRYGFELHGRRLQVRKTNTAPWQLLRIDDGRGTVTSEFAGVYTRAATGDAVDGDVASLWLDDNGRFYLEVEGLIGCTRPGHLCPGDFLNGRFGWTEFTGTWTPTTGGVIVTPTDDNTGAASPPFTILLARDADGTAAITASLGRLALRGPLTVHGLHETAHEVSDADLTGRWLSIEPEGVDPMSIFRTRLGTGANDHVVIFDAATSEVQELSPNPNADVKSATYRVLGDPEGGSLGVIIGAQVLGQRLFAELHITELDGDRLVAHDERGFEFVFERQAE